MNIYLANGNTLLNTSTDGNLSWVSPAFTDEFKNVALESIVNVTILTFTQAPCTNIFGSLSCPHNVTGTASNGEWDYAAASCALYPCLKNYHGSVNRGQLTEDIISSAQAKFNWIQANLSEYAYYSPSQTFMAPGNMTALKDPCVINGFEYTAASNFSGLPEAPERRFTPININGTNYTAPEECLYTLSQSYVNGMLLFFDLTLIKQGSGCNWADDSNIEPDCGVEWWLAPLFNFENGDIWDVIDRNGPIHCCDNQQVPHQWQQQLRYLSSPDCHGRRYRDNCLYQIRLGMAAISLFSGVGRRRLIVTDDLAKLQKT
jgi:hypothetical protein